MDLTHPSSGAGLGLLATNAPARVRAGLEAVCTRVGRGGEDLRRTLARSEETSPDTLAHLATHPDAEVWTWAVTRNACPEETARAVMGGCHDGELWGDLVRRVSEDTRADLVAELLLDEIARRPGRRKNSAGGAGMGGTRILPSALADTLALLLRRICGGAISVSHARTLALVLAGEGALTSMDAHWDRDQGITRSCAEILTRNGLLAREYLDAAGGAAGTTGSAGTWDWTAALCQGARSALLGEQGREHLNEVITTSMLADTLGRHRRTRSLTGGYPPLTQGIAQEFCALAPVLTPAQIAQVRAELECSELGGLGSALPRLRAAYGLTPSADADTVLAELSDPTLTDAALAEILRTHTGAQSGNTHERSSAIAESVAHHPGASAATAARAAGTAWMHQRTHVLQVRDDDAYHIEVLLAAPGWCSDEDNVLGDRRSTLAAAALVRALRRDHPSWAQRGGRDAAEAYLPWIGAEELRELPWSVMRLLLGNEQVRTWVQERLEGLGPEEWILLVALADTCTDTCPDSLDELLASVQGALASA